MKRLILSFLLLSILILITGVADISQAYDDNTHKYITGRAIKYYLDHESGNPLQNHPDYAGIYQWIMNGAVDENHTDHIYGYSGNRSGTAVMPLWSIPPIIKTVDIPKITLTHYWDADQGDYSLVKDPSDWYSLGGNDETYPNAWMKARALLDRALAQRYAGNIYGDGGVYDLLGHILHLIEDMSVPSHAHEDLHPRGDPYEDDDESYEEWLSYIFRNYSEQGIPYDGWGADAAIPGFLPGLLDDDINDVLYRAMYVTNQVGDYFASDGDAFLVSLGDASDMFSNNLTVYKPGSRSVGDGDEYLRLDNRDRIGDALMQVLDYNGVYGGSPFPQRPVDMMDLRNNDFGMTDDGTVINDIYNNDRSDWPSECWSDSSLPVCYGDLTLIESRSLVMAVASPAAFLKAWFDFLGTPALSVTADGISVTHGETLLAELAGGAARYDFSIDITAQADTAVTIELIVNGAVIPQSSWSSVSLPPGTHTVEVDAVDNMGINASLTFFLEVAEPSPPTLNVTVDETTVMEGQTIRAAQNFTGGHGFTITAIAGDSINKPEPAVTMYIDGQDMTPASWPAYVELWQGTHYAVVTATDSDGMISTLSFTLDVDPTPPPVGLENCDFNADIDEGFGQSFTVGAPTDLETISVWLGPVKDHYSGYQIELYEIDGTYVSSSAYVYLNAEEGGETAGWFDFDFYANVTLMPYEEYRFEVVPIYPETGTYALCGDVYGNGTAFLNLTDPDPEHDIGFAITGPESIDSDHDNVPRADDNCPLHPNADQADSDGDGIGDVCDICPLPDSIIAPRVIDVDLSACSLRGINDGFSQSFQVDVPTALENIDVWIDPISGWESRYLVELREGDGPSGTLLANSSEIYVRPESDGGTAGWVSFGFSYHDITLDAGKTYTFVIVTLSDYAGAFYECGNAYAGGILYSNLEYPAQYNDSGFRVYGRGCDDIDGDGTAHPADNCPYDANSDQADTDGDGLGNVCDTCPLDGDNDLDGDGICGDTDNCPEASNPDQADRDGDGAGNRCDPEQWTDIGDCSPAAINYEVGQSFRVDRPVSLESIEIWIEPDTWYGSRYTVELYEGEGYDGYLLGYSDAIVMGSEYSGNPSQPGWYNFVFSGDTIALAPDTSYTFVLRLDRSYEELPGYPTYGGRFMECGNIYPDGMEYRGSEWPQHFEDMGFRLFGEPGIDVDADGVEYLNDNCPYRANADQADSDSDGRGDACDACPFDPDDDADGDGICGDADLCPFDPTNDSDADGICNDVDNCPNLPNPDQLDSDGDGLGDRCSIIEFDIAGCNTNTAIFEGVGQSFKVYYPLDLEGIEMWITPFQYEATTFRLDLYEGEGASGTLIASSDLAIGSGDSGAEEGWYMIDLIGQDVVLAPETDYTFVLVSTSEYAQEAGFAFCDDIYQDGIIYWRITSPMTTNDAGFRLSGLLSPDPDSDNVFSLDDNCPVDANADQLDSDGDGMGDACDPCPVDADNDSDGDGFCSDADNCPLRANPDQADRDGDGAGDVCDPLVGTGISGCRTNAAINDEIGQSFKVDMPIDLEGIEVWIRPSLYTETVYYVYIQEGEGPYGTSLGGSEFLTIGAADEGTLPGWYLFDFSSAGITLAADTSYTFYLSHASGDSGGFAECGNSYPDGMEYWNQTTPYYNNDIGFGVYGTERGDVDSDGISFESDNCPYASNPDQLDSDGDGAGDVCDTCPHDADNDIDKDGVCGDADNCPAAFNPGQKDSTGNGTGDMCSYIIEVDTSGCSTNKAINSLIGQSFRVSSYVDLAGFDIWIGPLRSSASDYVMNLQAGEGYTGNILATSPYVLVESGEDGNPGGWYHFDFSAEGITLAPDTYYTIELIRASALSGSFIECGNVYPDGMEYWVGTSPQPSHDIGFRLAGLQNDDPDGDGVDNVSDNCTLQVNPDQTDSDGDGMGDACDICSLDPDNDTDGDGVCGDVDVCPSDPLNDDDDDGVCGSTDNCPDTANSDQADTDSDGMGDVCDTCPLDADNDSDGDGVCGDVDNCPAFSNLDQADSDSDGTGDRCSLALDIDLAGCNTNVGIGKASGQSFRVEVPTVLNSFGFWMTPNSSYEGMYVAGIYEGEGPKNLLGESEIVTLGSGSSGAAAGWYDFDLSENNITLAPEKVYTVLVMKLSQYSGGTAVCDDIYPDGMYYKDGTSRSYSDMSLHLYGYEDHDVDEDGVIHADDNCPYSSNADQTDSDGDGAGDACDSCPFDAANDADGDGVCGDVDNCTAFANTDQADSDGDGTGDRCENNQVNLGPAGCTTNTAINEGIGQGFKVGYNSDLEGIDIWIKPVLYYTSSYRVDLYDGEGLDGTLLASSSQLMIGPLNSGVQEGWYSFDFTEQAVRLMKDRSYTFHLVRISQYSGAYAECGGINNDVYPDGMEYIPGYEFPWNDIAFRIFANGYVDSDNDGAPLMTDNCLDLANPDQADADADLIGDACDACPLDADNDIDGDGVCGDVDNCPGYSNPDQADSNGDGTGDKCTVALDVGSESCQNVAINNAIGQSFQVTSPTLLDHIGIWIRPESSYPSSYRLELHESEGPSGVVPGMSDVLSLASLDEGAVEGWYDFDFSGQNIFLAPGRSYTFILVRLSQYSGGVKDCSDIYPDGGVYWGGDSWTWWMDMAFQIYGIDAAGTDDGDGVPDGSDNCLSVPNTDQTDTDGDGAGDPCDPDADDDGLMNPDDNCMLVASQDQTDTDNDGVGDLCDSCILDPDNDIDGDGICGNEDNCPSVANPDQTDADGDSLGDACSIAEELDSTYCSLYFDMAGGIGQSFRLDSAAGLDSIQVILGPSPNDVDTGFQMKLYEGDGTNGTLMGTSSTVELGTRRTGEGVLWRDFSFSGQGITLSQDSSYTFVLEILSTEGGSYRACGNVYPDGTMYRGDIADPSYDVGFRVIKDLADTDDDGDGIMYHEDNCAGVYNPDQADMDSDGNGDACDFDDDNDDLTNDDEVNYGTDPLNPDTDGDGQLDGEEVSSGTDPLDVTDTVQFVRLTRDSGLSDQPDVAVDSSGNVHIVWIDGRHGGEPEIYYKMLGPSYDVLINDTMITDDDSRESRRPVLAVDSGNRVFLVWQDKRSGNVRVYFARLEPSLDDRDGDAADPAVIKTVTDRAVSTDTDYSKDTPRISVDADDNLHIVWEDQNDYTIRYKKMNGNGTTLIPEQVLWSASYMLWRAVPDLAVSLDNRVHITWNSWYSASESELLYMLIDASTGSILISPTRMNLNNGYAFNRQSINVDNSGRAYIVWQYKNSDADIAEVYFMRIDPSLDDLDGDAAEPTLIKTAGDTLLTADDGVSSFLPFSRMAPGGNIHITWHESNKNNLHHMIIDQAGMLVSNSGRISASSFTSTKWTNAHIAFGNGNIVWSDYAYGNPEVVMLMIGDRDSDGIPDDGDGSGTAGDNPCTGGETGNCDDNCPVNFNTDQADTDGDGTGDECDYRIWGNGYNYPDAGYQASLSLDLSVSSPGAGTLGYYYSKLRLHLESTSVGSISVYGNTLIITGTGTVNGAEGYTYAVTIKDGSPDNMQIVIYNADGTVYFDSGSLDLSSGEFSLVSADAVQYILSTSVSPAGAGIITPDCTGGCLFDEGMLVNLNATGNAGYTLGSWTGCDLPTGSVCTMTIDADKVITANFEACMQPIRIGDVYYPSIQSAYLAASDGDTIEIQLGLLTEDLSFERDISITLKGGNNCTYSGVTGFTRISGNMTIFNGTVYMENIVLE